MDGVRAEPADQPAQPPRLVRETAAGRPLRLPLQPPDAQRGQFGGEAAAPGTGHGHVPAAPRLVGGHGGDVDRDAALHGLREVEHRGRRARASAVHRTTRS
ncbi:hypothetical protein Plo01_09830 [Planobispora longispora]|uniref:Uncharacterized protein n=1 Tax=Planobispora longispora TaxID=28887 RepID=A0A8J3W2P2_9ACTN|nr:hypothetical protein Plo01_09830 [Planobispora longispora]